MYDDYRRGGSIFGAFLLGGAVGAVLGLLFAPRTGRETREMIAERAQEYWGDGVDLYSTGRERVTEVVESGREMAVEKGEVLRAKIDEARGRLQETVAKSAAAARDKIGEVAPTALDAVDRAASATKDGIETAAHKAQDTLDFVGKKAGTFGEAEEVAEEIEEAEGDAIVPEV